MAHVMIYVGGNSFGKGFPLLPNSNVFINDADVDQDLVFPNAPEYNKRSMSGVVSHEITHLLIKKKFGYLKNVTLPSWKKEGYCEYIGGGSTLDHETGVRLWKATPKDGTGYQYFKYYMMVKYLLENEKQTVRNCSPVTSMSLRLRQRFSAASNVNQFSDLRNLLAAHPLVG